MLQHEIKSRFLVYNMSQRLNKRPAEMNEEVTVPSFQNAFQSATYILFAVVIIDRQVNQRGFRVFLHKPWPSLLCTHQT